MSVTETIAGWARELSEVGGRNTLLWAPESTGGYLDLTTAHPGGVSMLLAGRRTALSDLVRESAAYDDARQVARRIHDHARRLVQERGIPTLFLAVGVATWEVPRSRMTVEAPVLLRTATLTPTTPAEGDFHIDLGSGVEVNPALVNYLTTVAGIPVDAPSLASLTMLKGGGGFDPYPVYAELGRLCGQVPGFAVSPRLALGTYPYGKPVMVADVGSNGPWLAQVPVLAALAGDEQARTKLARPLASANDGYDPEREVLALDVDGDQQWVLESVRAGRSFVVDAPSGTGRIQTIAATVAALAHDGQSVLYVSPDAASRAALARRLADAGLGRLTLDLTGAAEDRAEVARALGEALVRASTLDEGELTERADPRDRIERATKVAAGQQALHDHVSALHEVREPWGVTAYDIQQAMAELAARKPPPASRVRLGGEDLRSLDRARLAEIVTRLQDAAREGAWSADPGGDPWYAADIRDDADVERAHGIVTRLAHGGFDGPARVLNEILRESSLPTARTPKDWGRAIQTMQGVRRTLEVFRPEIFDIPLDEHLVATGTPEYRASQPIELGAVSRAKVRRQAKALLRPGRPPADLHAELVSAQAQRRLWHDLVGAGGRPEISPRLDEAHGIWSRLESDLGWLAERLLTTDAGGELLSMSLPELRGRIDHLAAKAERLEVLPRVSGTLADLRMLGLGEVIDDFARRGVPEGRIEGEIEHIWWASIGLDITSSDARYAAHDGNSLRDIAIAYAEHDAASRRADVDRIAAATDLRVRERSRAHPRQTDLIHAQAGRDHGHLPFPDLYRETQDVLSALRPVLIASPYSAAQLFAPGTACDVVILDDGHRYTTAEAASALSRGGQALIVGDPWAAGPSAYRVGLAAPADADETEHAGGRATDAPSVWSQAAQTMPVVRLSWWHEPVDPRLPIADPAGRRQAVPAPTLPVRRLERVEGTATSLPANDEAIAWTPAEADRVTELVRDALAWDTDVAVVAFTHEMAVAVRDRLRDNDIDDDSVPVTTISQAHGLTSDTVILAVGYGRTPHGRVLHRFPSLADDRADSDLLLATTTARRELILVTTLEADDLDDSRLRSAGANRLLDLLRRFEAEPDHEAGGEASDPLLHFLGQRLVGEGLIVAEGVGVGEHRIELAVGHPDVPGRWLLAVESDGPRYAALPGVRARGRLRAVQMERLGWQHERVWSTDLYRDPAREVARIVKRVKAIAGPLRSERPPVQMVTPRTPEQVDDASSAEPDTVTIPRVREPQAQPPRRPDQTRDDTDAGWGERPDESAHDRWLQEQRPPHWE